MADEANKMNNGEPQCRRSVDATTFDDDEREREYREEKIM